VNVDWYQSTDVLILLTSVQNDANPSISVDLEHYADGSFSVGNFGAGTSYTFDEDTKQATITFEDTGAQLTFDLSDMQGACRGNTLVLNPGETLAWNFPPIILEEGTREVSHYYEFSYPMPGTPGTELMVERSEDGSFRGELHDSSFRIDLYFNEEGWVSGYKFTENGGSTEDPSVGVKRTGSLVEGAHCVISGTSYGTFNIDLSAVQIANKTGAGLVINGSTIKSETLEPKAIFEESKAGFASLSPSALSVDENGVLSRLKDNGDWEPVYLVACAQFAAMNSAEERNGVYYATPASGDLRTGVSGKDGMGTITSGTLERSTTDLAHELSEMIKAQHAYAANTKVLSTLDDMLEELERL
jgi:flagellar hook-basal body protein